LSSDPRGAGKRPTLCKKARSDRWGSIKGEERVMAGGPGQDAEDDRPAPPPDVEANRPTDGGTTRAYGLVGIGFEFVAAICLFGAIGWWVDRRLNTFPWLTLVGGALGFAAGLTMLIRAAHSAFKD
jgi:putative F0F1-ATPase subunit (Ca2+/Mg2+ transporter)